MSKKLNYVTLFSSGGVGCYGFHKNNFNCISSIEILKKRIEIQKANNICKFNSGYISEDIRLDSTKRELDKEINLWKSKGLLSELDVIIATPPCQGMSVANHKKNNELKRNSLVIESINIINKYSPKFFIFENVRAFLKTECTDLDGVNKPIKDAIEKNLGGLYNISYDTYNFKDFGVPSSRTRTLVIGVRKNLKDISPFQLLPSMEKVKSLKETIGDLKPLKVMGEIDSKDIYHNFKEYSEHMRSWISDIKEGESAFDNKDELKRPHKIINGEIVFNKNKNGDKYSRCYWNKVSPCIHTRNDILSSQSTIHPRDDRVFSIRELMRIMSVPDNFKWSNDNIDKLNELSIPDKKKYLKKHEINIRQVLGEAVPTLVFDKISKNISKYLTESLTKKEVLKIISEKKLTNTKNLNNFLKKNFNNYSFSELLKICEFSNLMRDQFKGYYTPMEIGYNLVKDLPDFSTKKEISILEPSVGCGNIITLLIEKYSKIKKVNLYLFDLDLKIIETLKLLFLLKKIPKNFNVYFENTDFLLKEIKKKFDLVVGNPPFGKCSKEQLSLNYDFSYSKNLFILFFKKSLEISKNVGLIIPKNVLSSPEYKNLRDDLEKLNIYKISDFGETGFEGVKIETISILVENLEVSDSSIKIESLITKEINYLNKSYIIDKRFPYWLIYRNSFFDEVTLTLRLGVFTSFRDRQITKKDTKLSSGKFRVLKSRNLSRDGEIINIKGYDTFVDNIDSFVVKKFLNSNSIIIPNLSYYPRASFLPKNSICDGSLALINTEEDIKISNLNYFKSEEFYDYYRIARNFGTRSLNIDKNSIYFWGIKNGN